MARVRVNGSDAGVAWCAPWRLEITRWLKPGANELVVEVANRWPNRMIGDQSLPPEKRLTSASWNPFKKDTPLVPSGLLGPVVLDQGAE
jgi:hypothetical protein